MCQPFNLKLFSLTLKRRELKDKKDPDNKSTQTSTIKFYLNESPENAY
jgi:hypothetical protein